jgi:SpoVK/Ycf46/Vps4 family AAA+-type ATPase
MLAEARRMAALEACTLAAERREAAGSRPQQAVAQLSRHVDAMEALTDGDFFTIAQSSPQALCNLLARLGRIKKTIEMAARK